MPFKDFDFPAGSVIFPVNDPAELDKEVLSNKDKYFHIFLNANATSWLASIKLPDTVDPAGTVEIFLDAFKSASTGTNFVMNFKHSITKVDDSADKNSSIATISATFNMGGKTIDRVNEFQWPSTGLDISSLGWVSGDEIDLEIERNPADGSDNFTEDIKETYVLIRVPIL